MSVNPILTRLSPLEFEEAILRMFSELGYSGQRIGGAGDGGVDLKLVHSDGHSAIVQCKRYNHPVGPSVVRELLGTLTHEKASRAYLVTTSSFTRDTERWAAGKEIVLIDGEGLSRFLRTDASIASALLSAEAQHRGGEADQSEIEALLYVAEACEAGIQKARHLQALLASGGDADRIARGSLAQALSEIFPDFYRIVTTDFPPEERRRRADLQSLQGIVRQLFSTLHLAYFDASITRRSRHRASKLAAEAHSKMAGVATTFRAEYERRAIRLGVWERGRFPPDQPPELLTEIETNFSDAVEALRQVQILGERDDITSDDWLELYGRQYATVSAFIGSGSLPFQHQSSLKTLATQMDKAIEAVHSRASSESDVRTNIFRMTPTLVRATRTVSLLHDEELISKGLWSAQRSTGGSDIEWVAVTPDALDTFSTSARALFARLRRK